ncbi:Tyramine receptor type 2 [Operophtera brumata]|uniref:Tyramine receptor type 2 n=1 Tax=Operophtera brumata TaxID=104452 RepID=A0A0L7LC41_OPEBR|nr:Tyramine receptor type 2 [Operophtera brumata]
MITNPEEKWTTEIQTEYIIENTKNENTKDTYNFTNDLYQIVNTEAKICDQNFTNITNMTLECDGTDYDSIEISVVIVLFLLIVTTVIGNTLIISAVVTTKRLRTVTNCFVTSLAVADLLVGIFVMPPAIAVHITGES